MDKITTLPTSDNKPRTPPNIGPIPSDINDYFVQTFTILAQRLHASNIARGFWPTTTATTAN